MLQEIDELDQFRITVQQLEVCRSLILKDGEAHCRSALILLDHISEVILYRIMQDELERDEFTRKVLPQRYVTKKKRNEIQRFPAKLDAVASVHHLPPLITTTLKILHSYRNAAQHRDRHNPAVLPILARISFVATADFFARTAAGFKNRGIGGLSRPIEWLNSGGLSFPGRASGTDKTSAVVQVGTTNAINKQIGGMEPLTYAEGKRRAKAASRFLSQIKIDIASFLFPDTAA